MKLRSLARRGAAAFLLLIIAWTVTGVWFVHHPRAWIDAFCTTKGLIAAPLLWIGNPVGDFTDALGLTGDDATVSVSRAAPTGNVLFAGLPKRLRNPAPEDITVLDRGEFLIGWSPRLKHPVWCAYHVPSRPQFENGKRPKFRKDPAVRESPTASDYLRSGFDRGHMAPNFACATRFGPELQERTFLMTNITPQTPQLNRGVWREIEHRIAELWTRRWGEIWVIVGCISDGHETIGETGIDIPSRFYQLVVAQRGQEVRAFAVLFTQDVPWEAWPTRYLLSIDELEELTGLDFLADLDDVVEEKLEARLPSRLWPVSWIDVFRMLKGHAPAN